MSPTPQLFGVSGKSNRDTTAKSHWGKNEFNSSFPTALLCYMHSISYQVTYIKMNNAFEVYHDYIGVDELFGINPQNEHIYFSFEDAYVPSQPHVLGQMPRSDLVIMNNSDTDNPWSRGLEIKLTALPDNTTHHLSDDSLSC